MIRRFCFLLLVCALAAGLHAAPQPTVTWTGAGDGTSWNDAANWNTNTVPGPSDDAVIDKAGTNIIVLSEAGASVKSFTLSGTNTLRINTSLTFSAASEIGASAKVEWHSGTLGGAGTLTNNGTLEATGIHAKLLSGKTMTNAGTLLVSGTGDVQVSDLTLTNTGVIDLASDSGNLDLVSGDAQLINTGVLRKSGGPGEAQVDVATVNAGTIDVQVGTLQFARALEHQDGADLTGAGTFLAVKAELTHSGDTSPSRLTWSGNYAPDADATLNIDLVDASGPGTGHGQLVISGTATLGGALNLDFAGPLTDGDTFVILTAEDGISGTFTPSAAIYEDGFLATIEYSTNDVTVRVQRIDADYAVSMSASAPVVDENGQVTFMVVARNLGPDDETEIPAAYRPAFVLALSASEPAGLTFESVTVSNGTFSDGLWTLNDLPVSDADGDTLTVVATVNGVGRFTSTASVVKSGFFDATADNNTASASVFSPPTYDGEIEGTLAGSGQYQAIVRLKANEPGQDLGTSTFTLSFNDDALSYASASFANFDQSTDADYAPATVTVVPVADGPDQLKIEVALANAGRGTPVPARFIDFVTLTFSVTDASQMPDLAWVEDATTVRDGDNTTTWLQGTLTGKSGGPAVVWVDFDAKVAGRNVTLTWETATENGNAGFTVERWTMGVIGAQPSGKKWKDVGFVEGAGTSAEAQSYKFRIIGETAGQHVYRLRQVDLDGTVTYSKEIRITVQQGSGQMFGPNR
ncbi:MAG: DUF11 domain-containing protein [Bacteroidota bacterium]